MQTTQTEQTKAAPRKLTVTDLKITAQAPGFTFTGKYIGTVLGSPFQAVDKKTGEVITKQIVFCVFEDTTGARFKVARDKGLETALTDAMVNEGDTIKVVKLEKINLKTGTMNQYDIYAV